MGPIPRIVPANLGAASRAGNPDHFRGTQALGSDQRSISVKAIFQQSDRSVGTPRYYHVLVSFLSMKPILMEIVKSAPFQMRTKEVEEEVAQATPVAKEAK